MIKIGITGSLGSGKSTVSKLISEKKYPLFSADKAVKEVYKTFIFKKKIKNISWSKIVLSTEKNDILIR